MKKTADLIVKHRIIILTVMIILGIGFAALIPRVNVNTDMTKYLPDSSPMKQGLDIMTEEFGDLSMENTIRVMFTDLPEEEKPEIKETLSGFDYVSGVDHEEDSEDYNRDGRTLYVIRTQYGYHSDEAASIVENLEERYGDHCGMIYHLDQSTTDSIPMWIIALALVLILTVLVLMSTSFMEPVIYMVTIGIAVLINEGSNFFLGGVSVTTHSIGALLQLVLSLDYSIMVMEHFRQAKEGGRPSEEAMSKALTDSFRPVLGSAVTTVAGLLMLCFMSFKIGADLGIVLSKGVVISLFCVFTVMPALTLKCEKLIEKTEKPVLPFPSKAMGRNSFRLRKGILVFFVFLMAAVLYLKGNTEITFTLPVPTEINDYFPQENQIVVLYDNKDEENILPAEEEAKKTEGVRGVITYAETLGKAMTADEFVSMLDEYGMGDAFDSFTEGMPVTLSAEGTVNTLLELYNDAAGREKGSPATIPELLDFIADDLAERPIYSLFFTDEIKESLDGYRDMIKMAEESLVGENYSMMVIQTVLPDESDETMDFLKRLDESLKANTSGDYYLIGTAPMAYEMSQTFQAEMNKVSLLTILAVFIVVLLTFRRLLISVLLVALIQTAVYITVVVMGFQGLSMYYLAFLVVQSILMGATIDYGIVFTNYYRESRKTEEIREAVVSAYRKSNRTILTSGLIIVLATIVLGYAYALEDPSIGQICHTIAKGTTSSLILILFILPGILCALDKLLKD